MDEKFELKRVADSPTIIIKEVMNMDEKFELKRVADSLEQLVVLLKNMTSVCGEGEGRVLDVRNCPD